MTFDCTKVEAPMNSLRFFIALLLATGLVVLGAQNTQSVTFHFLMFDIGPAPVVLMVVVGALIGALLTFLLSLPGLVRAAGDRRELEKRLFAEQQRSATAVKDMEETRARARPPENTISD